jgi:hypothetical protein
VNDDPSDKVVFGTTTVLLYLSSEEVQRLLTGLWVSVAASGEIVPKIHLEVAMLGSTLM